MGQWLTPPAKLRSDSSSWTAPCQPTIVIDSCSQTCCWQHLIDLWGSVIDSSKQFAFGQPQLTPQDSLAQPTWQIPFCETSKFPSLSLHKPNLPFCAPCEPTSHTSPTPFWVVGTQVPQCWELPTSLTGNIQHDCRTCPLDNLFGHCNNITVEGHTDSHHVPDLS